MSLSDAYAERLNAVGADTLAALRALEVAARRLHPPLLPELRERLAPLAQRLQGSLESYRSAGPPAELERFHGELLAAAEPAEAALRRFCAAGAGTGEILESLHLLCRAQEALYPLCEVLPPVTAYFLEPGFISRTPVPPAPPAPPAPREESGAPTEAPRVGLFRGREGADGRGGFALYVPEWYDASRRWPLVVALHGGYGNGRDFLFTWLREARSRGFLLLAPTSRGRTWSLDAPALDGAAISRMVEYVSEHWRVDPQHRLVTGLSDGATFALLAGLAEGSPFTHLAPVSGVLHPANFAAGNLERAAGRPIRLVHGALDWMFPVALARAAAEQLERAGAQLVYREIEDLSHTYPREENAAILAWFDPSLAAPAAG